MQLLAEHGADIGMKNDGGDTPLMLAGANGHLSVAEFLIDRGAPLHEQNNNGVGIGL